LSSDKFVDPAACELPSGKETENEYHGMMPSLPGNRRERNASLSHRRLGRAAADDVTMVRAIRPNSESFNEGDGFSSLSVQGQIAAAPRCRAPIGGWAKRSAAGVRNMRTNGKPSLGKNMKTKC
jgi:hypothetical protein